MAIYTDAEIISVEPYKSRNEFGTAYWIEGRDRYGNPFTGGILLGFSSNKEDGSYYLTCKVVWDDIMDYVKVGNVPIDRKSIDSNQFSQRVEREMEKMLLELLNEYPEFQEFEESLWW
jgi:hypothetical protein